MILNQRKWLSHHLTQKVICNPGPGYYLLAGSETWKDLCLNIIDLPDSYCPLLITSSFFKRRSSCSSRVKNFDWEKFLFAF